MNIGANLVIAESIKMRRSFAFGLSIISPGIILTIGLLIGLYTPDITSEAWVRIVFTGWAALILPIFVALCATQLAGIEHRNHMWKHLDAQPLARWQTFLAKQTMLNLIVLFAHMILLAGILVFGGIISLFHHRSGFGHPSWTLVVGCTALCFVASMFMQAIQHWIAMQFSNVIITIGSGFLGLMGVILVSNNATSSRFYPWSMSMQCISELFPEMRNNSRPLLVLGVSLVGFLAISLLGCHYANRREIL